MAFFTLPPSWPSMTPGEKWARASSTWARSMASRLACGVAGSARPDRRVDRLGHRRGRGLDRRDLQRLGMHVGRRQSRVGRDGRRGAAWPRRRRRRPSRRARVRSRRPAAAAETPANRAALRKLHHGPRRLRRALVRGVRFKPSEALRFLGGLAAAVIVLGADRPARDQLRARAAAEARRRRRPRRRRRRRPPPPAPPARRDGLRGRARRPRRSQRRLAADPGLGAVRARRRPAGRPTSPLIAREIRTDLPAGQPRASPRALAAWEAAQRLPGDGMLSDDDFQRHEGRRPDPPAVRAAQRPQGSAPTPPPRPPLEVGRPGEGYGGKQVLLRPARLRRLAPDGRRRQGRGPADRRRSAQPDHLLRLPQPGRRRRPLRRARATATASSAPPARRTARAWPSTCTSARRRATARTPAPTPTACFMSRTPAYRWLVANADRFGFVHYPFEPWHWEWTGEAP